MTFNLKYAVEILSRTPKTLESLLSGISEEWWRNNEGKNSWSPYDVIGHLIHGEKTDWIVRAEIVLSDRRNKTFEPFGRFAQRRNDQKKHIKELLEEFDELRKENLKKLKSMKIDDSKLILKGVHPELGEASLQQLLSAWVVHDLGHISQITRVMAKQYKSEVGPWKAYLGILS